VRERLGVAGGRANNSLLLRDRRGWLLLLHSPPPPRYSEEEKKRLFAAEKYLKVFNAQNSKDLGMRSPLTKGKVAFEKGDSRAWGWSSTIVRARVKVVLAYVWDIQSRDKRRVEDLEKEVDEQPNAHNCLIYRKLATPAGISTREFLTRAIWRVRSTPVHPRTVPTQLLTLSPRSLLCARLARSQAEGDGFMVVTAPDVSEKRTDGRVTWSRRKGSTKGDVAIRAEHVSILRITPVNSGNETKLEFVIHPDAGGRVPHIIFNVRAQQLQ
jgi:hypothetical protein